VVSPLCGLGGSTLGETTSPFPNQRRNGRALSSLTARSGGLPIGVISFSGSEVILPNKSMAWMVLHFIWAMRTTPLPPTTNCYKLSDEFNNIFQIHT
jgi:hypothetical protein